MNGGKRVFGYVLDELPHDGGHPEAADLAAFQDVLSDVPFAILRRPTQSAVRGTTKGGVLVQMAAMKDTSRMLLPRTGSKGQLYLKIL
jgi:hypothetical protein